MKQSLHFLQLSINFYNGRSSGGGEKLRLHAPLLPDLNPFITFTTKIKRYSAKEHRNSKRLLKYIPMGTLVMFDLGVYEDTVAELAVMWEL